MPPALDFPASPTVGQKYPSPAVTGVPVYSWDGEKWTTLGGALGSTGASDAIPLIDVGTGAAGSSTLWSRGDHAHPTDTAIAAGDALRVAKAGDTMTGFLTLSDNPTAILHAATKQYVDGGVAGIPGKVSKAGDTMTGPLVLPADPTLALQAATKQYVDAGNVTVSARFQRFPLVGLTSLDVPVPSTAVAAKLTYNYTPTGAGSFTTWLQLSISTGVFRSTAGDYYLNGFVQSAASALPGIASASSINSIPAMQLISAHDVPSYPTYFEATLIVKKSTSVIHSFPCISKGIANFGAGAQGVNNHLFVNSLLPAIAGSVTSVLAFRLLCNPAQTWNAESYLNVEWL